MEKLVFSVDELGKALKISRPKAYELANTEGFPSIRLGKRLVIPISALELWLEKQTATS